MSFRYNYIATMQGKATQDPVTGYTIDGVETSFKCDYQPTPNLTINSSGVFINIAYKLFVPFNEKVIFVRGANITCNGAKGIIIEPLKSHFNYEIWVK